MQKLLIQFFTLSIVFIIIVPFSLPSDSTAKTIEVPFFAQKSQYECGVAAVVSLLKWNTIPATYEEVKKQIYSESAKGTFPISIELFLRNKKIKYTVVQGNLEKIQELIKKDIPSIVLLKRKIAFQTINHFYVVTGIEDDLIIVHNGRKPFQKMKKSDFLSHWSKSNYWLLYVESGGDGERGNYINEIGRRNNN